MYSCNNDQNIHEFRSKYEVIEMNIINEQRVIVVLHV